ncbi:hypothetical protein [Priestia megaterium]|uniref:hypothetical protein n=1 Tax=Priestia megaterium TaxID=1404 RepID=UPI0022B92A42|nr:hypothetical protein [Priestia megaterium]MCZ8495575.1 hypothetical protein [Priestia megaterium]
MNKLKISFSIVRENVDSLLSEEGLILENSLKNELFIFLSKICVYQEEEVKIRPNIIICSDIKAAAEGVTNSEVVKLNTGKSDGSDMSKILKSIVPFCNNGWIVFIDLLNAEKGDIDYGIIRSFNGITGLPFVENITEINPEDVELLNYKFIEIRVLSNFEVQLQGLKNNSLVIDFRIHDEADQYPNDVINDLVGDIISGINFDDLKNTDGKSFNILDLNRDLKNSFSNFLKLLSQKVHGTILLIVKEEFQPGDLLKDGVWLDKPINLTDYAMKAGSIYKDITSNEIFYAFSSLLIEMMNIDGITVINCKGEILAYNVFVNKSSTTTDQKIGSGGARKRAAKALVAHGDDSFIGVYFQSQDGHAFYERVDRSE